MFASIKTTGFDFAAARSAGANGSVGVAANIQWWRGNWWRLSAGCSARLCTS